MYILPTVGPVPSGPRESNSNCPPSLVVIVASPPVLEPRKVVADNQPFVIVIRPADERSVKKMEQRGPGTQLLATTAPPPSVLPENLILLRALPWNRGACRLLGPMRALPLKRRTASGSRLNSAGYPPLSRIPFPVISNVRPDSMLRVGFANWYRNSIAFTMVSLAIQIVAPRSKMAVSVGGLSGVRPSLVYQLLELPSMPSFQK